MYKQIIIAKEEYLRTRLSENEIGWKEIAQQSKIITSPEAIVELAIKFVKDKVTKLNADMNQKCWDQIAVPNQLIKCHKTNSLKSNILL